jgi:hypothetical protein
MAYSTIAVLITRYVASSCLKQTSDSSAEVLELPVRRWTQDYKEFLEAMVRPEDKAEVQCLPSLVEKAVKCGWGRSARAVMPLCLSSPSFSLDRPVIIAQLLFGMRQCM